ncbi:MAG: RNA 2',3'-cyclic phosphodiesterase [Deltaproteobacteria bacterium]|jgi:2'-5' RNA ligase|nr:RNA 2',3'-cyclic phosphodiesterase [Deltaproteobacteria bacterium]
MEIRSFLAFELPEDIKTIVTRVSGEARKSSLDVRWVRPEFIHLTVVFLGGVQSEQIPSMGESLGAVCVNHGSFSISLKPMGCFPNSRNPRVIWLGLVGDLERMSRFRDDLQAALSPFGIKEEERAFRPHLTLGRFKKPAKRPTELEQMLAKYGELSSPVCTLDELVLFRSDLKPGGAVYTKMLSWPLSSGSSQ